MREGDGGEGREGNGRGSKGWESGREGRRGGGKREGGGRCALKGSRAHAAASYSSGEACKRRGGPSLDGRAALRVLLRLRPRRVPRRNRPRGLGAGAHKTRAADPVPRHAGEHLDVLLGSCASRILMRSTRGESDKQVRRPRWGAPSTSRAVVYDRAEARPEAAGSARDPQVRLLANIEAEVASHRTAHPVTRSSPCARVKLRRPPSEPRTKTSRSDPPSYLTSCAEKRSRGQTTKKRRGVPAGGRTSCSPKRHLYELKSSTTIRVAAGIAFNVTRGTTKALFCFAWRLWPTWAGR